jgi:NTP pyrophosphatase (non-canonical NTP hydrolase)
MKLDMENKMKNYIELAKSTEPTEEKYFASWARLGHGNMQKMRILHAVMGLATESGELLDAMKKHIFYGKELDFVNLLEEHGDLFWYAAILADAVGFTFEESMERNIAKLKARYPNKFTEESALIRDLNNERNILEK